MRLLALVALVACGPPNRLDRDDFAAITADEFCDRMKECARGDFDRDYFGMDDCVAHVEYDLVLIDQANEDNGCAYDEQGAARAWKNLDRMSCEEFYEEEYLEDYESVWDCG